MSENLTVAATAPAHVPPELVYDFVFENVPGIHQDAVRAGVAALRGMPDIFYSTGQRRPGEPGYWIVSRHELMREIFQTPETFSSRNVYGLAGAIGESWNMLPIEEDPPEHDKWRLLLNPIFSPAKMKVLEVEIEGLIVSLIENLKPRGHCDFVREIADVFPIQIFLKMFGLPLEETVTFVKWSRTMSHSESWEDAQEANRQIIGYLKQMISKRRAAPTNDLLSYVVTADVDGAKPTDDEAIGFCFLLFVAGLDTVAAMLSFIFKHLAEHPADQQRLRNNPDDIPQAIEEFLRAYPIVLPGRRLSHDVDFHGVKMKKGDLVKMPTMAAGRDEREFPDPNLVDFDREHVSHITFGAGPHRCVGSHLARRELRIALVEWLKRIAPFQITPGKVAVTDAISVFGVKSLPLSW